MHLLTVAPIEVPSKTTYKVRINVHALADPSTNAKRAMRIAIYGADSHQRERRRIRTLL